MLINEIKASHVFEDCEKTSLIESMDENLSINREVEDISEQIYERFHLGRDAYDKALNWLRNKVYKNIEEYRVAFLIYTHADFEEDGFVNQLYQDLKNDGGEEYDVIIKNSPAFKYYKFGKTMLNDIANSRDAYEKVIKQFGYRFNDFLSIFTNNNKRFIKKIGKVLTKYNEELMRDGQIDLCDLGENG